MAKIASDRIPDYITDLLDKSPSEVVANSDTFSWEADPELSPIILYLRDSKLPGNGL